MSATVGPIETYPQHGSIRGLVDPNSRALDQQQKKRIPERPQAEPPEAALFLGR
jgi:hypothetical protein